MADINIKPDIALGLQKQDSITNLGNVVNTATALQSFRKAQELLPYELEAGKAQSDLAVQNFLKARELLPYELETGRAQSSSAKSTAEKAKLEVERSQIETDRAKQEFDESTALANLVKNPELYMGADGRPDINKLNKLVPLLAPRTGAKFLKEFTELNTSQIQGAEAKNKLDTDIRGIIAGPLGILGRAGEKDKEKYVSALKQLGTQYKDNKDVSTYINSRIKLIEALPAGYDLPSMAIMESESLLSPTEQRGMAQQTGTLNTGGRIESTITTPSVLGKEPITKLGGGISTPVTLGPGSRQVATGKTDLQGQPTYYIYGADGTLQGEFVIPAGGGNPIPVNTKPPSQSKNVPTDTSQNAPRQDSVPSSIPVRLPPGTTQAQYEESQKIRENALQSAGNYQNQLHDNNKIIELAKKATTGVGAETLANLAGGFSAVPWTGDKATYFNDLGHYLDKQAATLASGPGFGTTDAGRQMAQSVSGTTQYTAESLINIARINRALSTGNYLFSQGIENGSKANTNDVVYARKFKNEWNKVSDVNALKLIDAQKNSDDEEIREIVKSLGGDKSKKYEEVKLKIKHIFDLVNGKKKLN